MDRTKIHRVLISYLALTLNGGWWHNPSSILEGVNKEEVV
jgi:hypothetical protein